MTHGKSLYMANLSVENHICYFCAKPIEKLKGSEPDSLIFHHISSTEVVSAHNSCHMRDYSSNISRVRIVCKHCGQVVEQNRIEHLINIHGIELERYSGWRCRGSPLLTHFLQLSASKIENKASLRLIEIQRRRSAGATKCYFCKKYIELETHTIHHIDGNHDNNSPENLVDVHLGCHIGHHVSKRIRNGNYFLAGMSREEISKILHERGIYNWTEERRERLRRSLLGNTNAKGRHWKWHSGGSNLSTK